MLVLIDNYDSFTYNLFQALAMIAPGGAEAIKVIRNDCISLVELEALGPTALVISPGPGHPSRAGISISALEALSPRVPTLGICLGHQAIALVHSARVVPSNAPCHGKTSSIRHGGSGLFAGLPSPIEAARYHSLIVEPGSLPAELIADAWSEEGFIMSLRHRNLPIFGLQFHPESFMTPLGTKLLENFLSYESARVS